MRSLPMVISLAALLAGCGESEIQKMSDAELRTEHRQCEAMSNPSPWKATACGNYAKECEERRESKGYSVC